MPLSMGFPSELSWKIFLDRYTVKDPQRAFQVGDLAIALVEPHPKWPKKDVGVVRGILPDGQLSIELLTGPQKGDFIERRVVDCDRPVERTIDEVAKRIARGVAKVEKSNVRQDVEDSFAKEIAALHFVPGGRIWAGAGTDQQLTYFNCYVIPSPKDSREGIVETLGQMIEIMSRGGGVGINVSSLRPARAAVRGVNGRSSGAVSWMDLYSRATGLVEQGGSRRGALMLQIEDWHPDIWRFIDVKKTPGMVENANISVRISDSFMEAVKTDGEWNLVFPDTTDPEYDKLWDGNLEKWKKEGKPVVVYETVKARKIWNEIIQGAWQAAEPGIVFDERHERDSNSWYFNPLISTNPCVTGDTLIATQSGLKRAEDLAHDGNPVMALVDTRFDGQSSASASPVFYTGIKPIIRLTTQEGYSIRLTRDHRVYSEDRGWVEAGSLQRGERIRISNQGGGFGTEGTAEEGRVLGWLVGDGHLSGNQAYLSFYGAKRALSSAFAADVNHAVRPPTTRRSYPISVIEVPMNNRAEIHSTRLREFAVHNGLDANKLRVPDAVFRGTEAMQAGFLQALFEADGTVNVGAKSRTTVRLCSKSLSLLREVQTLLLNFSIQSHLYQYRHTPGFQMMPDGHGGQREYYRQGVHDLVISGASLLRFADRVGFLSTPKQNRLVDTVRHYRRGPYQETWAARVASAEEDGVEAVYDLTEPRTHSFIANGLVVHNCAEQPLPAWGVCTLGHVNLAAFFDHETQDVNWDGLRTTIRMGVRFLDDILDATPYFFQQNYDNQQKERRIGLGTMGLGELLIRLGLRYGSPESLDFIDKLYQFIAVESYVYDVELAKEKGAFPAFDSELYLQSGFIQRLPETVREAIRQHGVRNVTILTQAPTGTVGTMVGTSTGIEPYYALTYFRQSRLGYDEQDVPVAAEWKEAHSGQDLPPYFVGAMDLTPEEHIYVQAAVQRWTDSSISKTANAPSSYTVEDTARLYELAYDLGCKGVTIYRDQSRNEQVLHLSENTAADKPSQQPSNQEQSVKASNVEVYPVPPLINGRTYRKETPAGTARVVINEVDGNPFEVFMLLGRAGSEVQSFMESLGRVISLYLRSDAALTPRRKLELVAEQLKGIGGANQMGFGPGRVLSVVDGIGQLLESHLRQRSGEETAATSTQSLGLQNDEGDRRHTSLHLDLCPQCDAPTLVFEEGCQHCPSCGYSRC